MGQIIRFIREWTLPVAITVGMLVYLLFAYTPRLLPLGITMQPILSEALPVLMFFVLYITFCKVDYRKLLPVGWHLWVVVLQLLFCGTIIAAVLYFHVQGINRILLESVLISAICPCASAAAVVTQKLGGNLEEMTSYTFISNFLCAFLIPLSFPLIEPNVGIHFVSSFWAILYKVSFMLVLPMLLAYITKHVALLKPLLRWLTGIKDLSYYLWCAVLMIVSGTTLRNILHASAPLATILDIGVLALVLCIMQFGVGRWIGRHFHRKVESGQALGQKNTAFAIWIASTYLNPLSSVGPGCYILWQNIINSLQIWQHDRIRKKG